MSEQRIAGEKSRCFIKGFMGGGPTAAKIIVVHAGQVVMHERIGVHTFYGDGGRKGRFIPGPKQFCGGENQGGAQTFTPAFDGVAHGLVEAKGAGRGRREVSIETLFDTAEVGGELIWKTHSS